MDVASGLRNLDHSPDPVFVVVGVFDGLHLGHAYLLRHLAAEASSRQARPVVITFDHHPEEIITGSAPPLLCDPAERLERLAAAGVDTTVVVHFDRQLRETTYDAFVAMIAARAPVAGFLMTPDAAFGYQRAGTPDALTALGRAEGFEVVVVPPLELDGRPVRSTEVRDAIATGDLDRAARLLGRPHAVVGSATPDGDGGAPGVRAAGGHAAGRAVPGGHRRCARGDRRGARRDGPAARSSGDARDPGGVSRAPARAGKPLTEPGRVCNMVVQMRHVDLLSVAAARVGRTAWR